MDQVFVKGSEDLLLELGMIRKANGTNSKGNPIRMTMCPLGVNTVQLRDVKLKNSNGKLFIQLLLQPSDRVILGERHKIAPVITSVFQPEDVGRAYAHVFNAKPVDMPQLEYMQHICRRMATWIGVPVEVAVVYDKSIMRDNYGKMETDGAGKFTHLRVVYYPRIVWSKEFSWDTAVQMSNRDKKDYEQWYKENKTQ